LWRGSGTGLWRYQTNDLYSAWKAKICLADERKTTATDLEQDNDLDFDLDDNLCQGSWPARWPALTRQLRMVKKNFDLDFNLDDVWNLHQRATSPIPHLHQNDVTLE